MLFEGAEAVGADVGSESSVSGGREMMGSESGSKEDEGERREVKSRKGSLRPAGRSVPLERRALKPVKSASMG